MPASIIGNPAVVTGLYQAFNGKAPGYNTYTNNLAFASQNGPSAYAAEIGAGYAHVPAATLADSVLANLGIDNAVLEDALGQIFTAYPVQARGQIVLNLINLLTNLEGDATYGAAAVAWNKMVASNNAYSSSPTNQADAVIDATVQTLTSGADNLVGNIFNAPRGFTPGGTDSMNTLNDDDVLTGTGTNPTLNFTYANDADTADYDIMPTLNGVETVNVAFASNEGALRLDLQDSTGIKNVNLSRISSATATVTIDNLTAVPTNLSITNSNNNVGSTVQFLMAPGAADGSTDETTLTLSNVNVAEVEINDSLRVPNVGVETINLVSSGATNRVGTLNIEDTEKLIITGDKNLTIGEFQNAAGSLTLIDGSAATGNLDLNINGLLNATADGTSGVNVALTVKTGTGADTVRVTDDTIGTNDSIDTGTGTDTLVLQSTAGTNFTPATTGAALVKGVEALQVTRIADTIANGAVLTVDLARIEGDQTIRVANLGDAGDTGSNAEFRLNNLSAAEATGITVIHSSTGNNGILNNTIRADVDAGVTTVGVTIAEGVNANPRFNFILQADSDLTAVGGALGNAVNTVANVTLTDNDTESNTVALAEVARHFGTLTVAGTSTGFLNLDTTTAGGNGGLYRYDISGAAVDGVGVQELSNFAGQVKFVGATFDSSAYAGNVVLRVDTARTATGETATGGQNIKFGAGNDTVIFDKVNDSRAGLTISDVVDGGAGNDVLAIDGQNVRVTLGASEWTNVTGFETIRLIGNGAAAVSNMLGQNSYNLTLTNELVANNGVNGLIAIVNDNDPANDLAGGANTIGTAAESGVTIDARALNANMHFSYNGEENGGSTADRFVFADANINGANIIDGGAVDNLATTWAANTDVIEVRNAAVVSVGDLANISNVGILAFTTDQATNQAAVLELNDTVLDALVDSYHTATTVQREVLTVRTNDVVNDLPGAAASTALDMDLTAVTGKFQVNVTLGQAGATQAVDTFKLGTGGGLVAVTNFDTTGTVAAGTADGITVSASQFGLTVGAGNYNATGGGIVFGALGTGAVTDRLYVVEGAPIAGFGGGGNDIGIYYDADGSGAGAAVLIGVLVDTAANTLSGAGNSGITVVA